MTCDWIGSTCRVTRGTLSSFQSSRMNPPTKRSFSKVRSHVKCMYSCLFACVCLFDCLFVLLTSLPAFTGDVYRTLDLRKCLASHCRLESLHILTSTFTNLTKLTASFNRLTGEVFFHFTSTLFSLTQNIYFQT